MQVLHAHGTFSLQGCVISGLHKSAFCCRSSPWYCCLLAAAVILVADQLRQRLLLSLLPYCRDFHACR